MCGRLNVIDAPLSQIVSDMLGIQFSTQSHTDLRPTEQVATIAQCNGVLQQLDTTWGIRPDWANRIIINAQAETVASKRTFAQAFAQHRCLVPCSGWYEWKNEGRAHKTRVLFQATQPTPFFMAGIWYPAVTPGQLPALVTLTTQPNNLCGQYHNRMPLLILPEHIAYWYNSQPHELQPLLTPIPDDYIQVQVC
ncbi:MAG: SOS response-associated peptidase [Hahellaceae bacterium]|nr:SOS response-associated peptidase [Hahellaceae bacterium]